MYKQEREPRWWGVYLLLLVLAGSFWWESRTPLTPLGHEEVQIGIVLAFFILLLVWLHAESVALMRQSARDAEHGGYGYHVVRSDEILTVDWPSAEIASADANADLPYAELFNAPVIVTESSQEGNA